MLMADTKMTDDWIKQMWAKYPCRPSPTVEGNFLTGPVRLSYPKLFERGKPRKDGSEGDYGVLALIPEAADISLLEKACADAIVAKWPNAGKPGGPKIKRAIKDQEDLQGRPGTKAGSKMFNANAKKQAPGIFDHFNKKLENRDAVYPGCWAILVVRPYTYDVDNQKGVTFGLQSVTILPIEDIDIGTGTSGSAKEYEGVDFSGLADPNAVFGAGGEAPADKAALDELYG